MIFDHTQYIPCLRWKTGEYQAVLRLPEEIKKKFTPLIEVPEFGFDFDKKKEPRTIDDHVGDFPKRVHDKWGKASCFIDMKNVSCSKNMANGKNPIVFILDKLLEMGCSFIPVAGLNRDKLCQDEIKKILHKDKSLNLCLRIRIDELASNDFRKKINLLLSELDIEPGKTHLIIDLGAPNFTPLEGFVKAIQKAIVSNFVLNKWLTFSIIGTSFPKIIGKGVSILPRYEWQLYKKLIEVFIKENLRLPAFGDYAIAYPELTPDIDWRIIKPAANIRYTIDDSWYIDKGKSLRDGPITQCHEMSLKLVKSSYFLSKNFSFGDLFIYNCATDKTVKTRSLTLWRQVGTNHHLMKVASDIANFYASLKNP